MRTTLGNRYILHWFFVLAGLLVVGWVVSAAAAYTYNSFQWEIVAIWEDTSTTRISNNKISLQHNRIDLLIEAVDEDGRLIDDDDRYRIVAVIEENGYYEKTVSATYKRSEDAWLLSTTLGRSTDTIKLFLLCTDCRTWYLFGHEWAYKRRYIVDLISFKVALDDDYSSYRKGAPSYRKWKNFEDYKDFFNNNSYSYKPSNYHSTKTITNNYYYDYGRYSWKDYRSLKWTTTHHKTYANYISTHNKQPPTQKRDTCYSSRCAPTNTVSTTPQKPTYLPPTYTTPKTSTPCLSTTAGCGKPYVKPDYTTPTYTKPTTTKTYYYNNPTQWSTTTTSKVYQCSSGGCQWVYTQG